MWQYTVRSSNQSKPFEADGNLFKSQQLHMIAWCCEIPLSLNGGVRLYVSFKKYTEIIIVIWPQHSTKYWSSVNAWGAVYCTQLFRQMIWAGLAPSVRGWDRTGLACVHGARRAVEYGRLAGGGGGNGNTSL